MVYKKIDYYYFGGMVAEDIDDIFESLVVDNNESIRKEIPDDMLERFDNGEYNQEVYDQEVYYYIASHVKSVYIEK